MAYDLYSIPPPLKPCESIDATDTRYLNQTHAPLIHSLKKALYFELYNEKSFNKPRQIFVPPFPYKHANLQLPNVRISQRYQHLSS